MRITRARVVAGSIAIAAAVLVALSPIASTADPFTSTPSAARVAVEDAAADPEHAPPPPPQIVGVASAPFGARLVDRPGRTLYVFSLDTPGTSECDAACTARWVPARSFGGKPQPGPGATAPQIGNIQRPDGSEQMTFNGFPLYFFAGDGGPGQSNGHGRSEFGGRWSAQPPARPAGGQ